MEAQKNEVHNSDSFLTRPTTLILHMEGLFYNIYDIIALLFLNSNFETRGCVIVRIVLFVLLFSM
jgi:hypothetical protein